MVVCSNIFEFIEFSVIHAIIQGNAMEVLKEATLHAIQKMKLRQIQVDYDQWLV